MQFCILQKTNAWLAKGENGREEIRFGINIPTLLYIKCIKEIANKGLLLSTGKYAEYFITNKGKEPGKQYVFLVYKRSYIDRNMAESLYYTHETNTTWQLNYLSI